jgi:hypothetical protein
MKRIIILLALFGLFYSTCLGAEYAIDKGANVFGISGAFIRASGDLYESGGKAFTAILVMPHTSHFFFRNFAVGGDLLLLLTAQGDDKSTTIGLGPKISYFFGNKDSKSYPYLTTGFYYLRNDMDYGDIHIFSHDVMSGTRFKIGAGTNWMIDRHLGFNAEISYNRDRLKPEDGTVEFSGADFGAKSGNMVIVSIGLVGFTF